MPPKLKSVVRRVIQQNRSVRTKAAIARSLRLNQFARGLIYSHKRPVLNTRPLMFKRDYDLPTRAGASSAGYVNFSGSNIVLTYDALFSDMPNYTDFAPFDRFRIRKISMRFTPTTTNVPYTNSDSGISTNPTFLMEDILHQFDPNGGSAPATRAQFYQTGNCRKHNCMKPFSITYTPHTLGLVYGSSTGYADVSEKSRWIDMAYAATSQHFRMNIFVPTVAQPAAGYAIDPTIMRFAVRCTMWFEVSNLKS